MVLIKNLLKVAKKSKLEYYKRDLHITRCLRSFLDDSPNAQLAKNISDRYMCLPIPEPKAQLSYIWIDGTGVDLRVKSRTLDFIPSIYKDCPNWGFDGSSTFFGTVEKSDHYIVPIAMYADPFRRGNNKLVLCETFTHEKKATKTNKRQCCIEILNKVCDQEATFGFEQQFYFMGPGGSRPYGWPSGATPDHRGKNYAGIGPHRVIGREIVECIYRCCLYVGVDVYGTTSEKGYGQWEILTGPTVSIKAADDLWIVRYIIQRVAEDFGIYATFRSNVARNAITSGLHTCMSTKRTREEGGLRYIQDYIRKLEKNHQEDIKHYDCAEGVEVRKRLTGHNQTCHVDKFRWGVGDRSACIKISPSVADKKKGFFEDRRPCACADPYEVITVLVKTCLL